MHILFWNKYWKLLEYHVSMRYIRYSFGWFLCFITFTSRSTLLPNPSNNLDPRNFSIAYLSSWVIWEPQANLNVSEEKQDFGTVLKILDMRQSSGESRLSQSSKYTWCKFLRNRGFSYKNGHHNVFSGKNKSIFVWIFLKMKILWRGSLLDHMLSQKVLSPNIFGIWLCGKLFGICKGIRMPKFLSYVNS